MFFDIYLKSGMQEYTHIRFQKCKASMALNGYEAARASTKRFANSRSFHISRSQPSKDGVHSPSSRNPILTNKNIINPRFQVR